MNKNNISAHFITIFTDDSGQRIDNFLCKNLKGVPKNMIYRILRKGEVRVNKKRVKAKYKLKNNDKVRIPPVRISNDRKLSISSKLDKMIKLNNAILYEDEYLLALNKPAGIAVHGGSGLNFNLIEDLRNLFFNTHFLELVHRLDRDTSGVLLLAKKRSILRVLHEQLRAKSMQKNYLALVRGYWKTEVKKIKIPLIKNTQIRDKEIMQVNSGGRISETIFSVEERFAIATLVKAIPITGRTHQIRVHARYAGHPIAFDNRYGDNAFDQKLKGCGLSRLFLHAVTLCFNHPKNGKTVLIEAPIDKQLHKCLEHLRINYKQ